MVFGAVQIASLVIFIINTILAQVSLWVVAFNMRKGIAFLCALVTAAISATSIFWNNPVYAIINLIFQLVVGGLLMIKFSVSKVQVVKSSQTILPSSQNLNNLIAVTPSKANLGRRMAEGFGYNNGGKFSSIYRPNKR